MVKQVLDVAHMVRESLIPAPDGVRTTFQTSKPFTDGTLSVWINGLLYAAQRDPWRYTTGVAAVTFAQAPRVGDTLQVQYEELPA